MQLDGKLAVITGGISGLGRATAERFAKEGARVVIADINAEKGETAAQEMSAGGAAIEFIAVNVTDESSQQALFDDVVRRYGQLDIVVAAAGISSAGYVSGEVSTPAEDPEDNFLFNKPIADWQRVLDVNLTGGDHRPSSGTSYVSSGNQRFDHQYRVYRGQASVTGCCGLLRLQGRSHYVDHCLCHRTCDQEYSR